MGVLLFWVWRTARTLLNRGVTTTGTVISVEPAVEGAGWISTVEYADITGNTHTFQSGGSPISTETVDTVYDPEKPSRASLHTPPNPKAEKWEKRALWVLLLLSWSVALAGLLLLVGVLG